MAFSSPAIDVRQGQANSIGKVWIFDSPSVDGVNILSAGDNHLTILKGFLERQGYTAEVVYHLHPQNDSECGYRAIITAYGFCVPHYFGLSSDTVGDFVWKMDQVIKFFNSIIEWKPRSTPKWLSRMNITHIIGHMEFLYLNFELHVFGFLDANYISDLLRKIKMALESAVTETESYSEPMDVTVKYLIGMLEIVQSCTKSGAFDSCVREIRGAMNDTIAVDYAKFGKAYGKIDYSKIPDWFEGVFSFREFQQHMLDEKNRLSLQLVKKSAIVNTHESPGQHWFTVIWENADNPGNVDVPDVST